MLVLVELAVRDARDDLLAECGFLPVPSVAQFGHTNPGEGGPNGPGSLGLSSTL